MRVLSVESVDERVHLENFCDYLIKMGDGKLKVDSTGGIKIQKRFLLPVNDPQGLLQWVYGDRPRPLTSETTGAEYSSLLQQNIQYYSDKAIMCPKNIDVDKFNE